MNLLDRLAFQEDMEERYQADYDLWIWTQECEYWYLVLILVVLECPHLMVTLTQDDWMVF